MSYRAQSNTLSDQQDSTPDLYRYNLSRNAPDPITGTPYLITGSLESIWSGPTLEDVHVNASRDEELTFDQPEEACCFLENIWTNTIQPDYASQSDSLQDAIKRLQTLNRPEHWGPDIVFKAFADLDKVISCSLLKGSCQIRWRTYEQMATLNAPNSWALTDMRPLSAQQAAEPFDNAPSAEVKAWKFTINLNADRHFLDDIRWGKTRWQQMWGTLLHEMAHCYLRRMVTPWNSVFVREEDKDHGVHFQRVLRFINTRLKSVGVDLEGSFEGKNTIDKAPEKVVGDGTEHRVGVLSSVTEDPIGDGKVLGGTLKDSIWATR